MPTLHKISAAVCVITIALLATTAHAATISLSPASQNVGLGEPLTVDLNISGLGNGTALSVFDISVNFDSAELSFGSATFGDPVLGDQLDLGNLGLNGPTATPGNGTVDLIEADIFDSPATLLTSQAHSFTLAALTFYDIAAGTTPITLTVNSLADQEGNPFTASTLGASVTVAPVPIPASGWMLLAGLFSLALALRGRILPAGHKTTCYAAP
jgi:hypothetical protein